MGNISGILYIQREVYFPNLAILTSVLGDKMSLPFRTARRVEAILYLTKLLTIHV